MTNTNSGSLTAGSIPGRAPFERRRHECHVMPRKASVRRVHRKAPKGRDESPCDVDERILWMAYPSWRQFSWLYFFSLMTGLRSLLFYVFTIPGWESWLEGTALLLVVPVFLRRWAVNSITSRRILVRNGYTGREIVTMPLERVEEVSNKQRANRTGNGNRDGCGPRCEQCGSSAIPWYCRA
jgi:hypothetical protein